MTAPHLSDPAPDSAPSGLVRDVDAYVRQLAEVSSRTGGAAEPAAQATAWAEAHRVSAWGLRAAVSAARDQGLSWRELAELLDVPAATLHRQYRAGQALAVPDASIAEPAPVTLTVVPPPAPEVPASIDLFVGRDRALADAPALLANARLLTLAGPGGVGKTRLASELSQRIRGSYRGGILWAELAPVAPVPAEAQLGARAGIEAAIVAAAGPGAHGKRIGELLATACATGPVLLVLDNCEHLVEEAARTASSLLTAHPLLRILATSREPLRIPGETILPVRPLTDEPAGTRGGPPPAVRLFVDRARAASADFDPDTHAKAIAELCEQLDGLPLAIELAARQIAVLPPAILLSRLAERLDLLSGGPRNAPHRQQSLRAAIEWSYQLLDPTEQAVFRRLAILPGGFDQRTAAAVTADLGLGRAALWGLLATLASK
ncbi:MAG: hypothetical protein QOJ50_3275, partial [Cryptosporangiaceae bacterium]|nr:hypothetical protein [Cryptosporangiaceae bacterium]